MMSRGSVLSATYLSWLVIMTDLFMDKIWKLGMISHLMGVKL
jgi:hypothetical protein